MPHEIKHIGIEHLPEFSKVSYFDAMEDHGLSLIHSIKWDFSYTLTHAAFSGFAFRTYRNFLLGGCAVRENILIMDEFIRKRFSKKNSNLTIIDQNSIAIARLSEFIESNTFTSNPRILNRSLLATGMADGCIDYIRTDLVHSFFEPAEHFTLMEEMGRILSSSGLISTVIAIPTNEINDKRGEILDEWGNIAVQNIMHPEYWTVDVTRDFLTHVAKVSGLSVRFGKNFVFSDLTGNCTIQHVVWQKRHF